jgi:hypothetical protein
MRSLSTTTPPPASGADSQRDSPRRAPEVAEVLQGIRRTIGVSTHQKDPTLIDTLRALVEPMHKDDPGT